MQRSPPSIQICSFFKCDCCGILLLDSGRARSSAAHSAARISGCTRHLPCPPDPRAVLALQLKRFAPGAAINAHSALPTMMSQRSTDSRQQADTEAMEFYILMLANLI